MQLSGTMSVVSKDTHGVQVSSTQATFGAGSTISITVDQYGSQCVPLVYTMQVDGSITLDSVQATYIAYLLHDDASSGQDMVDVSGTVQSACFGTAVSLLTINPLAVGSGACPTDGSVVVNNVDTVSYTGTGGVEIDIGSNGPPPDQTFTSCLDLGLYVCP
jgi:hypothetical protein